MVQNTPNGVYSIGLTPKITTLADNDQVNPISYPIRVSGDRASLTAKLSQNLKASTFTTPQKKTVEPVINYGPDIKVKLSYFEANFAKVSGNEKVEIWSQNRKIDTVPASQTIQLKPHSERGFNVSYGEKNQVLDLSLIHI